MARPLVDKGKIRIDYVIARIREEKGIPRCHNCLQYGHSSAKCDEQLKRRTKRCSNCSEKGHIVAACSSKEYKSLSCDALQEDSNQGTGMLCCKAHQLAKAAGKHENRRGDS